MFHSRIKGSKYFSKCTIYSIILHHKTKLFKVSLQIIVNSLNLQVVFCLKLKAFDLSLSKKKNFISLVWTIRSYLVLSKIALKQHGKSGKSCFYVFESKATKVVSFGIQIKKFVIKGSFSIECF